MVGYAGGIHMDDHQSIQTPEPSYKDIYEAFTMSTTTTSTSFPTAKLGRNGPSIPRLGFGLMGLSSFYGATESDELRFKVLDRAIELGETFWDSQCCLLLFRSTLLLRLRSRLLMSHCFTLMTTKRTHPQPRICTETMKISSEPTLPLARKLVTRCSWRPNLRSGWMKMGAWSGWTLAPSILKRPSRRV